MAVLAFSAAEARTFETRTTAPRQVVTRHAVTDGRVRTVAPVRNRTVVRTYYNGGYYGGGYYPYSYGPTVSVGFGGGYAYPYGYGYGYPGYAYGGYPVDYGYAYNDYPYTTTRTTYTTHRDGYYSSDNITARVQARLADAGYYHGVIDGVMGPQTRAAVAMWEARHGLVADGNIDNNVLRSLDVI